MSDKDKKNGPIVFIIIIIIVVLAVLLSIVKISFGKSGFNFKNNAEPFSNSKTIKLPFSNNYSSSQQHNGKFIAKLEITGTIEQENKSYNQKWLLDTIDSLKYDDNNVGIMLFIDSPGGGVYEADEVYLSLLDYKNTGKPVYAYMGSMAASGGYYISCVADNIAANRNTLTGCIGVLAGGSIDLTGLMSNLGIKYTTIHAGKNKNMGNYNEPLTDEQRAIFQSIADECYDQFTSIVAESRKMSKEDVVKLADGRIYTAKQAKDNGLIDEIASYDDALTAMENKEFKDDDIDEVDYSYEQKQSLFDFVLGTAREIKKSAASSASSLPQIVEQAVTPKTPFPAYYYDGLR
jgi:protease-4